MGGLGRDEMAKAFLAQRVVVENAFGFQTGIFDDFEIIRVIGRVSHQVNKVIHVGEILAAKLNVVIHIRVGTFLFFLRFVMLKLSHLYDLIEIKKSF